MRTAHAEGYLIFPTSPLRTLSILFDGAGREYFVRATNSRQNRPVSLSPRSASKLAGEIRTFRKRSTATRILRTHILRLRYAQSYCRNDRDYFLLTSLHNDGGTNTSEIGTVRYENRHDDSN